MTDKYNAYYKESVQLQIGVILDSLLLASDTSAKNFSICSSSCLAL